MAYKPKLNATRGAMTERLGFTKQDLELIGRILDNHDEAVIIIGGAEKSHEKEKILGEKRNYLMTGGERIDVLNYVLKDEGINPARYTIIPIKNSPSATRWVTDTRSLTPSWNKIYTRNFKNASMFEKFQTHYGYEVETMEEQKPEVDLFEIMSKELKSKIAKEELRLYLPESAIERMKQLGIDKRVNAVYNRENINENPENPKRALFLGRMNPFHGVYEYSTGHMGNIKESLKSAEEIVIALGSAQKSHREKDPLTAGKRIETIRYSLIKNGVDAGKFHIIPVKDIPEDDAFAAEVVSLCPAFNSIIAGNDWTKQLFGEGNYRIIPVQRNKSHINNNLISATYIRNTTMDIIRKNHQKGEKITLKTIKKVEKELEDMLDPFTLEILPYVGYYDTMAFLTFAKE